MLFVTLQHQEIKESVTPVLNVQTWEVVWLEYALKDLEFVVNVYDWKSVGFFLTGTNLAPFFQLNLNAQEGAKASVKKWCTSKTQSFHKDLPYLQCAYLAYLWKIQPYAK